MNEEQLKRLLELRGLEELDEEQEQELQELERTLKGLDMEELRELTAENVLNIREFGDTFKELMNDVADSVKDKKKRNKPDINGDASVKGVDSEKHWKRRLVRYFNALSIAKDSPAESLDAIRKLKKEFSDAVSERQLAAENKEANEVLKDNVSKRNLESIRHAVGVETRSLTTQNTGIQLLPKPFLAQVFQIIEDHGMARSLFQGIPMTSGTLDLKNVATQVVAFWATEGSNVDFSQLTLSGNQLTAKKLMGLTYWSSELGEDQAIALVPILTRTFGESMAEKEDKAAFVEASSGASGFTGILELSGANSVVFASTNTSGTDLTEAHVRSAKAAVSKSSRQNGRWMLNYETLDFISKMTDGGGNRLFPNVFRDGQPGTLLGDPVEEISVMPAISGVGADTPFIAYGDPQSSLFGQRAGITADVSQDGILQASNGDIAANAFQADLSLLRLKERVGLITPEALQPRYAVIQTAAS